MSYVIDVEGVLRSDTGTPIQDVEIIVKALIEGARVVFCSSAPNAEKFLEREGISEYARFYETSLLDAVAEERSSGYVGAVFTADTDDARAVFEQGITVFLVGSHAVVNAKWRPERKSWGEIQQEAV